MTGAVYGYDRRLYSRSFLNCYQRQSLVMLAERTPAVHELFFRGLVSTDRILEQVVREQRPKYHFDCGLLAPADLARIGVDARDVTVDDFTEARPLVLEAVAREGFALLVIDVFYLPHCPEYRIKHIIHTVILTGYDHDSHEWSIIDDNPASVLCRYTYREEVIAASFDNNEIRMVRSFSVGAEDRASAGRSGSSREFADLVAAHQDGHALLHGVGDLLTSTWVARERVVATLHDAFSVFQGSRVCLSRYTEQAVGEPVVQDLLRRCITTASEVLKQLLIARTVGSVDVAAIAAACIRLVDQDRASTARLRSLDLAARSR